MAIALATCRYHFLNKAGHYLIRPVLTIWSAIELIAYLVELPSYVHISLIFNISDLFPYWGTFTPLVATEITHAIVPSAAPRVPASHAAPTDQISDVLDHEVVASALGGFSHFLVRWVGRPDTDATWITEDEFRQLDPSLLRQVLDDLAATEVTDTRPPIIHIPTVGAGVKFFRPKENDARCIGPKLNRISVLDGDFNPIVSRF
ncbi:unnamed protein product [Prunus armeniaca]